MLATALGTLLAVGLDKYSRSKALDAFTLAPAIIPDVVLAIGLLAFFTLVQFTLGLHTVLLAHVVFNTAFVTAIVKARLNNVDHSLEEASRDLGATSASTFVRITLPNLAPGVSRVPSLPSR